MIYYFSGTGNCKHVAEMVAASLQDQAVSIETQMSKPVCKLAQNEVMGIVSPTYSLELPILMREFLEKLRIESNKDNYMFYIATYGTTPGASGADAQHIFKGKGLKFDACYSIKMPDNWTPFFDLSNPKKVAHINDTAEKEIEGIIAMILQKKTGNNMNRRLPYVVRYVTDISYQKMRKTSHFKVEDTCIGCGLCEKRCPVHAIGMENHKPIWEKDKCVMCLRCLHHCPKFSIQYGENTKKHGQYKNPHTKI